MPDVRVNAMFSFMEKPSKGLRQDDKNWGEGQIELQLEKLPETAEEWQEVSRYIGQNGNYAAVHVDALVPLDHASSELFPAERDAPSSEEIFEGEIVE